jgi:diguanylate cyclase (GGDEF)-like protein/putative nucleotidyltransferase with HDIG domain
VPGAEAGIVCIRRVQKPIHLGSFGADVLIAASRFFSRRPARQARGGASFSELPFATRLLIEATTVAGIISLLWTAPEARFDAPLTYFALLAASVGLAASKVPLPLLPSSATLSLSYISNFAALALLGSFEATLVVAAGAWSQCTLYSSGRIPPYRTVFSVANVVVSSQVAAWAAHLVGGYDLDNGATFAGATLAAATAFFFCNSVVMAVAVAQTAGKSAWALWKEGFLWSAPICYIGSALGSGTAYFSTHAHPLVALLALLPVYLVYLSYRSYLNRVDDQQRHLEEVSALHLASVEALARAISARDQTLEATRTSSDQHIRRVQKLAVALARDAGMSEHEIKGVEVAALLHDIGKLAVPEHILTKPGELTKEEYDAVKLHPAIGANIIRAVPFPYPVATLIEHHHERWNGQGYPQGLAGDAIPLGARILGIVDYFDALIADRPYHKAMAESDALEIIEREGGRALDPYLVKRFTTIVRRLAIEEGAKAGLDPAAEARLSSEPAGLAASEPSLEVQSALENITRANQEMRQLYEVAEAMGTRVSLEDKLATLVSKLTPLVPASAWALFLPGNDTAVNRCRFASGLDANLLRELQVPSGAGTIGWVALNDKCIANARPAADFEAAQSTARCGLQSMAAFPLKERNRVIGVLAAYHVEPDYFAPAHQRILERVSAQAAKVVVDAIAFEQIRTESLTDPLTGLANTRKILADAEHEMAKADRHGTRRALIAIDVDHFKLVNDRFGHEAGNRALRLIADTIRQAVRSYDVCARSGGDEFLVFLSECDEEQATLRAVEIQRAVANCRFEAVPHTFVPLAISVGHAIYPDDGATYEALLRTADERMYRDKSSRRTQRLPVGVRNERRFTQ